jgi:hypothetical protein
VGRVRANEFGENVIEAKAQPLESLAQDLVG